MRLLGFGRPKRRHGTFEDVVGFDEQMLSRPMFRDLCLCAGQVSMTEFDVSRLEDDRYLAEAGLEEVDVHNPRMQMVLQDVDVDVDKLEEPGYIADSFVRMSESLPSVRRKYGLEAAHLYARSRDLACVALVRFILEVHPEFGDPLKKMAPALRHAARG